MLHFAWLNKKLICHPSAFIYWEDEQPSQMDFGKRKYRYGGPFTIEQVEDVKVMLHILMVLFSLTNFSTASKSSLINPKS